MKRFTIGLVLLVILSLGSMALAESPDEEMNEDLGMTYGPSEQMESLAYLVGDWNVKGQVKFDPTAEEFDDFEANCTYSYAAGGGAMMCDYRSIMGGMPLEGIMIQTWDRETEMWQTVWVDNFACRVSYMEGTESDDILVLVGEDVYQGQVYHNRITISEQTDTSMSWKMESSMDGGETWMVGMLATYTKK